MKSDKSALNISTWKDLNFMIAFGNDLHLNVVEWDMRCSYWSWAKSVKR
jgi:hypothetical protein